MAEHKINTQRPETRKQYENTTQRHKTDLKANRRKENSNSRESKENRKQKDPAQIRKLQIRNSGLNL